MERRHWRCGQAETLPRADWVLGIVQCGGDARVLLSPFFGNVIAVRAISPTRHARERREANTLSGDVRL